jgi:hypothetical protein
MAKEVKEVECRKGECNYVEPKEEDRTEEGLFGKPKKRIGNIVDQIEDDLLREELGEE